MGHSLKLRLTIIQSFCSNLTEDPVSFETNLQESSDSSICSVGLNSNWFERILSLSHACSSSFCKVRTFFGKLHFSRISEDSHLYLRLVLLIHCRIYSFLKGKFSVNSFFLRTATLRSSLPFEHFPYTYDLNRKSRVHMYITFQGSFLFAFQLQFCSGLCFVLAESLYVK